MDEPMAASAVASPEAPAYWTLGTCAHLTLAVLLWQFIAALVLFTALPMLGVRWIGALNLVCMDGVWLFVLRTYRWRNGVKPLWHGAELRRLRTWLVAGAGLLVCLGANAARILLQEYTTAHSFAADLSALARRGTPVAWGPVAAILLGAVVLAPLVEEWSFRGILQGALTRRWGPAVAIPVTAVLFGLLHGFANAPVVTVYGLVFGLLAHRRGSLTVPMLVHGAINLVVLGFPVLVQVLGC